MLSAVIILCLMKIYESSRILMTQNDKIPHQVLDLSPSKENLTNNMHAMISRDLELKRIGRKKNLIDSIIFSKLDDLNLKSQKSDTHISQNEKRSIIYSSEDTTNQSSADTTNHNTEITDLPTLLDVTNTLYRLETESNASSINDEPALPTTSIKNIKSAPNNKNSSGPTEETPESNGMDSSNLWYNGSSSVNTFSSNGTMKNHIDMSNKLKTGTLKQRHNLSDVVDGTKNLKDGRAEVPVHDSISKKTLFQDRSPSRSIASKILDSKDAGNGSNLNPIIDNKTLQSRHKNDTNSRRINNEKPEDSNPSTAIDTLLPSNIIQQNETNSDDSIKLSQNTDINKNLNSNKATPTNIRHDKQTDHHPDNSTQTGTSRVMMQPNLLFQPITLPDVTNVHHVQYHEIHDEWLEPNDEIKHTDDPPAIMTSHTNDPMVTLHSIDPLMTSHVTSHHGKGNGYHGGYSYRIHDDPLYPKRHEFPEDTTIIPIEQDQFIIDRRIPFIPGLMMPLPPFQKLHIDPSVERFYGHLSFKGPIYHTAIPFLPWPTDNGRG